MNSALDAAWCTVQYIQFLTIISMCQAIGPGGFMWVLDASDAYLQLKIRQEDRHFLGVRWLGSVFVFTVLMLGLASALRIYTEFVDALLTVIVSLAPAIRMVGGVRVVAHYLDDFFGATRIAR